MFGAAGRLAGSIGKAVGATMEGVGPVGNAVLGADLLAFAGEEVVDPLVSAMTRDTIRAGFKDQRVATEQALFRTMKMRRIQAAQRATLVRLATMRPDFYNEVAYGRRFPKGATVIGGRPNYERLAMVAMKLATGEV